MAKEEQSQAPPQAEAPEQPPAPDGPPADQGPPAAEGPQLEGGTYEIIRGRLNQHAKDLRGRLDQLNASRRDVFGAVETRLIASERISTENNCLPRDMVSFGSRFIFGYNVFVGLRAETSIEDVFAVYEWRDGEFTPQSLDLIRDERFLTDFRNLYKYYRSTVFAKFAVIGPHLFMVFQTSEDPADVKTFKWLIRDADLEYLDNRSDHEFRFPPQHEFEWRRVTQDMHRSGTNPHISIEDRVFVETVGGDLTVKIEDNTATGEGIYAEPVDDPDQTLSDAEIHFAIVGNIILMKVRPYQEEAFRYLVYNEKIQHVTRIDSIRDACVLLPEGHGLIFPEGYYLQTGQTKLFSSEVEDLVFEKRLASPNGEDYLYVFYNRESGTYVLLSYNVIQQEIATPVVCNGYSFFDDGTLLYFRDSGDAQRHHVIQIWQTPYCAAGCEQAVQQDNYLFKIGNKDIVRCMAECTELLTLLAKEDTYANLYVDVAKRAQDIRDAYFWIDEEQTFALGQPLREIHKAASSAIEEFEKVVRTRQNTARQIAAVADRTRELIRGIDPESMDEVNDYVSVLTDLRTLRGEVIALNDLRYADAAKVEALDTEVAQQTESLSARCVEFLLRPESLQPYHNRVAEQDAKIPKLAKATEARELQEEVGRTGRELEMLTEIVSNLKIDDATQTTAIIEGISLIYQRLNQVKSALGNRLTQLGQAEGQAEFAAQMKLIDQAVANYLDVCDSPDKCDEYLTRVMVQMEALDAKFADFDEFLVDLAAKREEVCGAFESRKVQLVEKRNRRATALMAAAERILKGIRNRAEAMEDVNAIHGYFASDRMIERLRETIEQLEALGDTVKAEDCRNQLKSIRQDAIRQLKDKQALYEDGENVIRFGTHRFAVNNQALELTIVRRDGEPFYHLTGTGFFLPVTDEQYLAAADIWDMEVLSETPAVYRAEYLAKQMLDEYAGLGEAEFQAVAALDADELLPRVQEVMAPRYAEGYVKGVHDQDAAKILHALLDLKTRIGLLRYASQARALALLVARVEGGSEWFQTLSAEVGGLGRMQGLFDYHGQEQTYIQQARAAIEAFLGEHPLFPEQATDDAAEYLFYELATDGPVAMSPEAAQLRSRYEAYLAHKERTDAFADALAPLADEPVRQFALIRKWLRAYVADQKDQAGEYVDEVAAMLLDGDRPRAKIPAEIRVELSGMVGSHPLLTDGAYVLDYTDFTRRLAHHARNVAPKFQACQARKKTLVDDFARELRLEEFEPRVLTTFVRNRLIDRVYLQLVGDNLAKQIGTSGATKRTDRQGLLLLISPPGYGKTTLMAYIANRLGLTFVKINGPAVGHQVTSLDPAEAANAAAREEVERLNLAFEMGDNVMIYVDDIQHCNPEFLQKFISLCDAQRRVEGVFQGRTRAYDLRGKRVCVVMAGNPYTESGEKFRIPDMLANRADTYNIGDIVGDNYDNFVDSYVENCLTSNPVLGSLAQRSQADVYAVMALAQGQPAESVQFEGNYSADELQDYVATMKKLLVIREIVLKVNQEYIRSAGQGDEYRTEPPFLLQGSYRNMNRIASRVVAMMNDEELWTLILSAYIQDAQTLTTGAESNLLKFKELTGKLSEEEAARWEEIKKTFRRNKLLGGGEDQVGQVIRQLNAFGAHLEGIHDVLADAAAKRAEPEDDHALQQAADQVAQRLDAIGAALQEASGKAGKDKKGEKDEKDEKLAQTGQAVLDRMGEIIAAIKEDSRLQYETAKRHEALTINDNAQSLTAVLEEQFKTLELWLKPVTKDEQGRKTYVADLVDRFRRMADGYQRLVEILEKDKSAAKSGQAASAESDTGESDTGESGSGKSGGGKKGAKSKKSGKSGKSGKKSS